MKPKKNPKADLNRKWVLFLQIGLIIVLFLTLQAIEWETPGGEKEAASEVNTNFIIEETPPITVMPEKTPPPKPPKVITNKIDPIDDDEPVKEDNIAPTDMDFGDIKEVEEIDEPEAPEEDITYDFVAVEDVPLFPGCESLVNNDERKSCMSMKINNFVVKEFDTGLGEELGLSGTNTVYIQFTVNKQGEVSDIKTRAPHPALEKEARRVIGKLPKMTPGKQRGEPVPVRYNIPIRFRVQD